VCSEVVLIASLFLSSSPLAFPPTLKTQKGAIFPGTALSSHCSREAVRKTHGSMFPRLLVCLSQHCLPVKSVYNLLLTIPDRLYREVGQSKREFCSGDALQLATTNKTPLVGMRGKVRKLEKQHCNACSTHSATKKKYSLEHLQSQYPLLNVSSNMRLYLNCRRPSRST
jgi:hypothetical protein